MIEFQISGGTCNHEGKYKLMTLQGSIWHCPCCGMEWPCIEWSELATDARMIL
jgi:hypothetical protein